MDPVTCWQTSFAFSLSSDSFHGPGYSYRIKGLHLTQGGWGLEIQWVGGVISWLGDHAVLLRAL